MKSITTEELKGWIAEQKVHLLIDVREQWEHEAYNIGGRNIPLGELISRKAELNCEQPVVIYCEKGIRSVIAIQRLETYGFSDIYNLEGGMLKWRAAE